METEEERQARRRKRIEEMKKEKRRVELLRKCIGIAMAIIAGFGGCFLGIKGAEVIHYVSAQDRQQMQDGEQQDETQMQNEEHQGEMQIQSKEQQDENKAQARAAMGRNVSGADGTFGDAFVGNGTPVNGDVFVGNGMVADTNVSVEDRTPADGDVSVENGTPVDGDTPEMAAVSALGVVPGYQPFFEAHSNGDTIEFGSNITSLYGVVIDVNDGIILAGKDAMERMNPASMTKILTVLVAAEHLQEQQLDETVAITIDITDYCYVNDCSVTGYGLGEEITIRDLFYGTILPSGADSALALATYVAGSQEAFVDLMNEKLEDMGLAETTHFTNCVGLYDENHYSTAYDIAMILKAAVDNTFCREVLSMHIYTTSSTEQHPEGLRVSNMFLRRIEDIDTHGEVLCAKTGYVGQSGNCAASFSIGNDGREYLCVTAGAASSKSCIADQAELYRTLIPE